MLIQNCTIIDCTGAAPFKGEVLVKDGRIAAVGSKLQADGETFDAKGAYLLPGLANLHVHINRRHVSRTKGPFRDLAPRIENSSDGKRILYAARNAWYELELGITSMRDLCSVGRTASELKSAYSDGIIRGPRLQVCGKAIACTGGHESHMYKGSVEVDGPAEVMKATRQEMRLGADFIKLMACGGIAGMPEHENPDMTEFTVEEIAAACQVAHGHCKTVTVHAYGDKPVMNALLGGVDGIEHGSCLNDAALDIMEERGVYYVPTMSAVTCFAAKERAAGNVALADLLQKEVIDKHCASVRRAHKRGIVIGAGSDTPGSLHIEMDLLSAQGLSNMEVLQTATKNAGIIMGLTNRIGTIEAGKDADLLLVSGNPLDDLHNLQNVEAVFRCGERVTREWMMNLM